MLKTLFHLRIQEVSRIQEQKTSQKVFWNSKNNEFKRKQHLVRIWHVESHETFSILSWHLLIDSGWMIHIWNIAVLKFLFLVLVKNQHVRQILGSGLQVCRFPFKNQVMMGFRPLFGTFGPTTRYFLIIILVFFLITMINFIHYISPVCMCSRILLDTFTFFF